MAKASSGRIAKGGTSSSDPGGSYGEGGRISPLPPDAGEQARRLLTLAGGPASLVHRPRARAPRAQPPAHATSLGRRPPPLGRRPRPLPTLTTLSLHLGGGESRSDYLRARARIARSVRHYRRAMSAASWGIRTPPEYQLLEVGLGVGWLSLARDMKGGLMDPCDPGRFAHATHSPDPSWIGSIPATNSSHPPQPGCFS